MKAKKVLAVSMVAAMIASLTACGGSEKKSDEKEKFDVGFNDIEVGKDYTDVKADLKIITNRTDLVDNKFQDYIKEFQKLYPNVNIEYEGITDYANQILARLSTGDWGDICMVPTEVDKDELGNYFQSFGSYKTLSEGYDFMDKFKYEDDVYAVPSMVGMSGIVYNKQVFEDAGITEVPTTPDEFIEDLHKIKDNTEAIPLYTNFSADWPMGAWDDYTTIYATGDPDFSMEGLTKGKNPYSNHGDGTGPYAVYDVLYRAVKEGLTEDDPTTTDWEGSKGMMNNGKIACMALGSWAIPQIQGAGEHADDIGYMSFPITVDGKQYATKGPDWCYGINVNSSKDNKIASMCYVKWLVEESDYAAISGCMSAKKGAELPEALSACADLNFIFDAIPAEGEETLGNDVKNDSELASGYIPKQVLQAAIDGSKTLDEIMDECNEKLTAAQENNGITPAEYDYHK